MDNLNEHIVSNNNWIHLVGASDEVLLKHAEKYQLPNDYLSGVNDRFEIARSEESDEKSDIQRMAILLEYLTLGDRTDGYAEYTTHVVSMVHAKDYIITASKENPDYLEDVFNDFNTKDEIVYEHIVLDIFKAIQKNTIEKLREIHEDIEEMQNDIQKSSKSKELYRLIAIDKSLTKIQTAVQNNRKVLDQISESGRFEHSEAAKNILHDVMIESLQAESMVDQGIRIVDLLNGMFSNVISNNLNQIMKVLTSITIILTIPTIIAGFWGMNTPIPMENNDLAFTIVLIISIIISVIVAFWLRKKNYL